MNPYKPKTINDHLISDQHIRGVAKLITEVSAETGLSHADVIAMLAVLESQRSTNIEVAKFNAAAEHDAALNVHLAQQGAA